MSVYPGPPTERHSVAAVILGRGSNDELSPAEVSGFTRVQQAVGKRAVIATAPLVTEDMAATAAVEVTAAEVAAAEAGAGAVLSASRDDEMRPTVGQKTGAPGQRGKLKAAEEIRAPAATAAEPAANQDVRYVTLQFHSVSSRT